MGIACIGGSASLGVVRLLSPKRMKTAMTDSEEASTQLGSRPLTSARRCCTTLTSRWSSARAVWKAMAPAKLSIVIAMLVPIVFIWVDQAAEVLRCLAEHQVSDAATPWVQ